MEVIILDARFPHYPLQPVQSSYTLHGEFKTLYGNVCDNQWKFKTIYELQGQSVIKYKTLKSLVCLKFDIIDQTNSKYNWSRIWYNISAVSWNGLDFLRACDTDDYVFKWRQFNNDVFDKYSTDFHIKSMQVSHLDDNHLESLKAHVVVNMIMCRFYGANFWKLIIQVGS